MAGHRVFLGHGGGNEPAAGVPDSPGAAQHGVLSHTGYAAPYLTVFSENSIDVFDVRKAEWVQTVPLKKVRACPDPRPPALDWGAVE